MTTLYIPRFGGPPEERRGRLARLSEGSCPDCPSELARETVRTVPIEFDDGLSAEMTLVRCDDCRNWYGMTTIRREDGRLAQRGVRISDMYIDTYDLFRTVP